MKRIQNKKIKTHQAQLTCRMLNIRWLNARLYQTLQIRYQYLEIGLSVIIYTTNYKPQAGQIRKSLFSQDHIEGRFFFQSISKFSCDFGPIKLQEIAQQTQTVCQKKNCWRQLPLLSPLPPPYYVRSCLDRNFWHVGSLALRLRRICSPDETFKHRTNELKTYLNKRGYNLSFLNQEKGRINGIPRSNPIANKDTSDTNQPIRVPLVITYNPALRSVSYIIHEHFNILSSSPRCTNVFKALVAFRWTNNLSDLLVSAKLRNSPQNNPPHGSFRCEDN